MLILLAIIPIIVAWIFLVKVSGYENKGMIYGASFNTEYASYLGLDPRLSFAKILDDWDFKYIRLIVDRSQDSLEAAAKVDIFLLQLLKVTIG